MNTANLTREETAARARSITDAVYAVELDLRSAPDHGTPTFTSTTTVTFTITGTDRTWLDFLGEVDSVEIGPVGKGAVPVDIEYDGARIQLTGLLGRCTVVVRGRGRYSRSGEGLHRFLDPADGQTYLYTQYEPADCRRVFACFEQPDIKAPFTFTVHAPRGWEVLSNQNLIDTDTERRVFAPTLPISTYITAVVAGPYHRVESSWSRGDLTVPLAVLCRASLAEHLDADTILTVTRQGLDFFHSAFVRNADDHPYPFGKYDQVFVPEYNLGAMENPGCVTFTESYVFRGAATRSQYAARANTILHEMAHMWFGDLVTMRWWDDLWLKESFADYMGSLASVRATEFTDAWVSFAIRRKAWAYQQDQLPTTHPIVADIADLEAAKLNFDGITYAKGASVLKQLAAYVGEDAFLAGSRAYFRRHAYGNTTLPDLLTELSIAAGRPLDNWAAAWLRTSGVGELSFDRTTGVLVQRVPDGAMPRPQAVVVSGLDERDGALVTVISTRLDVDAARTPVDDPAMSAAPVVLVNDDDLTYAIARLDERSMMTVLTSLDRVTDTLQRALIWSALWNATRDALLPAADFLSAVARFAPTEPDVAVQSSILGNAAVAVERYSADREAARSTWFETTWAALRAATPGSDAFVEWFRAFATAAERTPGSTPRVRELLASDSLDPDQRWLLRFALAAQDAATTEELDAALAADRTASGVIGHRAAVSALPTASQRAQIRAEILDPEAALSNDEISACIRGFTSGPSRALIEQYDNTYFNELRGVWSARSIEIARRMVVGMFPHTDTTAAATAWLDSNPDAPAALRRLVMEQTDHLSRGLRARAVR